jgi:hypothetical protein
MCIISLIYTLIEVEFIPDNLMSQNWHLYLSVGQNLPMALSENILKVACALNMFID